MELLDDWLQHIQLHCDIRLCWHFQLQCLLPLRPVNTGSTVT